MANYFGDGSDGDVTISSDTSISNTQDGDYVVKNYKNLTIDAAKTLTTQYRCKGLFVYVQYDCTINGTLSMTKRGAKADPLDEGKLDAYGGGPSNRLTDNSTRDGGSGGGGGHTNPAEPGGTGTQDSHFGATGYGNNGGNHVYSTPYPCGSGGGASAAGTTGGIGGAGQAFSISGSSVTYGGGGGQCNNSGTATAGGAGGGGTGVNNAAGGAGTDGLGGGGGGSRWTGNLGGDGGDGVVIIRYTSATEKATGGTITTDGGDKIHTFTSTGTFTPSEILDCVVLLVGGGGGGSGSTWGGGGGGAGGVLYTSSQEFNASAYTITVGSGGVGAGNGTTGGDSSILFYGAVSSTGIRLPMLSDNEDDMIAYQPSGVDYGYKSGNLVFIKNQWNGGANNGEVDMTGTTLVDWNDVSRTVGSLNYGVALQEYVGTHVQKRGFIMYSTASVHTRFTGMDVNNADHFVGVYYIGSTWYYDNNTIFTSFTPVSTDLLVADLVWDDLSVVRFVQDCEGSGDTLAAADFSGCGVAVGLAVANQGGISGDGVILNINRYGAIGSIYTRDNTNGFKGAQMYQGAGGGGSGSEQYARDNHAGSGGRASCFSGGSGGGGKNDTAGNAGDGAANGGVGGYASGKYTATGGAGNPGGAGAQGGAAGDAGTGGVIWLIVGGSLTIGGSATIEAIGADGGDAGSGAGGAGSGGGVINIAYAGDLSNSGTIDISGGAGGVATRTGGAGGTGYYHLVQVNASGGGPLPVMLGAFC